MWVGFADSCLDVLNAVPVTELVFATRQRTPPSALLGQMEQEARALGVQWEQKLLKYVNWTACPKK